MLSRKTVKSSRIVNLRKLAQGKQCMIRLPGCNHNPETTVLAHYRLSGYVGIGQKSDDFAMGSWSCSACHLIVDGAKTEMSRDIVRLAHAEGCLRTMAEVRQMKARGELD